MDTLFTVKELTQAGQRAEAKALCQKLVAANPRSEEGLLQLLALDPTPLEEIAVLETLLEQLPQHRYAARFHQRLDEMRIVALLSELSSDAESLPTALSDKGKERVGEFLINQGVISGAQLSRAIAEQRTQPAGAAPRLGTLLVLQGALTAEQLAAALVQQGQSGFGEFGDYLIRRGVVMPAQLQQALARQVQVAVDNERRRQSSGMLGWLRKATQPLGTSGMPIPRLGEILVEMGLLTRTQLTTLLEERERTFQAMLFN